MSLYNYFFKNHFKPDFIKLQVHLIQTRHEYAVAAGKTKTKIDPTQLLIKDKELISILTMTNDVYFSQIILVKPIKIS